MEKLKLTFKESEMDRFKYSCSKFFLYLCIFLFAFILIINLTYSTAPVVGVSMQPTINMNKNSKEQDLVVLNYIKSPQVGDVIVAKKTFEGGDEKIYLIKRLIAKGGDRIEFLESGDFIINGKFVSQDFAKSKTSIWRKIFGADTQDGRIEGLIDRCPEYFENNILVIPQGYVFYLGDNRGQSTDCSVFGPVKEEEIIAKVDYLVKYGENYTLSILKQIFTGGKI